jgi:hypothetical protein
VKEEEEDDEEENKQKEKKSRPTQRKMKKSLPSCFFFFSSPFPVTNLTIPFFWPGSATVPTCAALPLFGQGILKKREGAGMCNRKRVL